MRGSSFPDIAQGQCRGPILRVGTEHLPDIRVFARPCTERIKLGFRLAHPCAEEIEFSQCLRTGLGIAVDWVKSMGEIPKGEREKGG